MRTLPVLAALCLSTCLPSFAAIDLQSFCGRYLDPKEHVTLEIYREGDKLAARQVAAQDEKSWKHNGAVVAKEISLDGDHLTGTIVSPNNGRQFNVIWTPSADHQSLLFKLKWGIISYSGIWKRISDQN